MKNLFNTLAALLIGHLILGKYLLPFDLISVLFLAALAGSAMLARRKLDDPLPASDGNIKNIEEDSDNHLKEEKKDNKDQEEDIDG